MNPHIPLASDGIPTSDGCRPAVLRVLSDGQLKKSRDISKAVADELGLSDEQKRQTIPSGQTVISNRAGWALSSLYKAGAVERPEYSSYRITNDGRSLIRDEYKYSLAEKDLYELPKWREYQAQLQERRERDSETSQVAVTDNITTQIDPEELLLTTIKEMKNQVATELLERLRVSDPEFFEKAVLDVISKIIGVEDKQSVKHLGKTGDGGIDGVVSLDPLGLRKIYVQAKRYADGNTIGSVALRNFYGALAERHADNGVFITSSSYTKEALKYASNMGDKIVLIDGLRLVDLMLTYKVGVQTKSTYEVLEIDEDFFE